MDLDELTNRVNRQSGLDGLTELLMGSMLIAYGLILFISSTFAKGSTGAQVYSFAQAILLAATNLTLAWGYRRLKARLVFPRTGYVAILKPSPRRMWIFGATLILVSIAAFIAKDHPQINWSAAAFATYAIVMALTLGIWGIRMNLPHIQALAYFAPLLGVAFTGRFPFIQGFTWFNLPLGAATFMTGAFRLRTFLKTHPQ